MAFLAGVLFLFSVFPVQQGHVWRTIPRKVTHFISHFQPVLARKTSPSRASQAEPTRTENHLPDPKPPKLKPAFARGFLTSSSSKAKDSAAAPQNRSTKSTADSAPIEPPAASSNAGAGGRNAPGSGTTHASVPGSENGGMRASRTRVWGHVALQKRGAPPAKVFQNRAHAVVLRWATALLREVSLQEVNRKGQGTGRKRGRTNRKRGEANRKRGEPNRKREGPNRKRGETNKKSGKTNRKREETNWKREDVLQWASA
eukprot:1143942-Pelagomonas_calceolata.AAC.9